MHEGPPMRKLILIFFILLGAAIGLLASMNGGKALRMKNMRINLRMGGPSCIDSLLGTGMRAILIASSFNFLLRSLRRSSRRLR